LARGAPPSCTARTIDCSIVADAAIDDPFRDRGSRRQLSDRLIIAAGELGAYTVAMGWVVRGYYVRPGRLIRVLTDLPFDRRGLASDPRYARRLRTAGLEFLSQDRTRDPSSRMNDLSQIPTETLTRMYATVRTILFVTIGIDAVAVAAFALRMVSPGQRRLVPIVAPILLLPTIAIVPVVGRLGAIGVELKQR
jgi:hypothetical protein